MISQTGEGRPAPSEQTPPPGQEQEQEQELLWLTSMLITSRKPADLPAFCRALVTAFHQVATAA